LRPSWRFGVALLFAPSPPRGAWILPESGIVKFGREYIR
jgi:hypothetical protein